LQIKSFQNKSFKNLIFLLNLSHDCLIKMMLIVDKSFNKNFVESFLGHVNAARQRDAGVHEDVQRSWSFGTGKFELWHK
jgi:hypothetical protein